jgi:glycosyltransferase involved in cell wall biosynthesis
VRLSIVVPVLDEAGRLEALLAELARDCPGVEVVVADGGSRDGSVEIAARPRASARVRAGAGAR